MNETQDQTSSQPQVGTNAGLASIGERLRTQDNRMTSDPLFVVFQKQRHFNVDDEGDGHEWRSKSEWDEASEAQAAALDGLVENFEEAILDGVEWMKAHYIEVDVFVTACFTQGGAEDYLAANGHNLRNPHIYASSLYRNQEMIAVREALMANNQADGR